MKTRSVSAREKKTFPTSDVTTHVYINPKNIKALNEMRVVKDKLEINGDIELYPSIHHSTFEPSDYTKICTNLVNVLNDPASNWCEGVNLEYVKDTLMEDHIMLVVVKHKQVLLGFSAINVYSDRMNLEIICTNNNYKGVGTHLNTLIHDLAVDLDVDSIGLEAVTSAVGFYLKVGYECVDDLCPMEKTVESRQRPLIKRPKLTKAFKMKKSSSKTKRSRSNSSIDNVSPKRARVTVAKTPRTVAKTPRTVANASRTTPFTKAPRHLLHPAENITYL